MFAACLVAGAASAQTEKKVWTDAPVPGVITNDVTPADRAGGNNGTDGSSPFSAVPTGARAGSQSNETSRDGGGPGSDTLTPNVSK
jgi:hypothetical protein